MDTNKIELTLSPELKSVDIGDKLKDGKLLEEMANLGPVSYTHLDPDIIVKRYYKH